MSVSYTNSKITTFDCNGLECMSGSLYDEQPVLSQNSINALECQSYISRVLAGILALQKPMEIPKTRLYIMLFGHNSSSSL